MQSYAVVWSDRERPRSTGKLELLPGSLRLEGLTGSEPANLDVPYETLSSVRLGRAAADRIDGRPAAILERDGGGRLAITTVAQPSVVGEIVDALARLRLEARSPTGS